MNDPLKDNRIFPEEMHQQKKITVERRTNLSWLWIIIGILLLAVLAWYGYQMYQNNQSQDDLPTLQEQQDIFNAIQGTEPISEEEHDQQIEFFFGGETSIY